MIQVRIVTSSHIEELEDIINLNLTELQRTKVILTVDINKCEEYFMAIIQYYD